MFDIFNWGNTEPKVKMPKAAKIPKVKTVKPLKPPKTAEDFKVYMLILSIISAILVPYYAVILFHKDGASFYFYTAVIFSVFFFIIAEIMMYLIYDDKRAMETEAWKKIIERVCWDCPTPLERGTLMHKMTIIQGSYNDSGFIRHTPPFALVLYILFVCICFNYILLDFKQFDAWFKSPTNIILLVVIFGLWATLTVKFINDLYNLVNNNRRMARLERIFTQKGG
ncbi:MAG: hypothetical protein WCO55_01410 [Candidatus Falkowbacteria bacterium]